MDEDALLAWLGGKTYRKLSKNKHKIKERADDDNGNDDKSSADFIPMESVSREYVKVKNREDKKKLDKGIKDSLDPKVAVDPDLYKEKAMDKPVREYLTEKDHQEELLRKKQIKESVLKQSGQYKPSKAEDKAERKQIAADIAKEEDDNEQKQIAKDIADEEEKEVPKVKPRPEVAKPVAVDRPTTPGPIAPTLTQQLPPGAESFKLEAPIASIQALPGDNAQQANPLAPVVAPIAPPTDLAPTARLPSLTGQLPPNNSILEPPIPGGNGELAGVQADDPSSKSLPLQLDIPVAGDEAAQAPDPVLSGLSANYQRAVSKPISLLGQPIDPASSAYEVADRAIQPLQIMNDGLAKMPTSMVRLANFVNYPIDKAAGTDSFGKNNKLMDSADAFVDSFGVTRAPTTPAERAFSALGMLVLPNPATMLAPVAGAVGVVANEGIYQVAEAVQRRLRAVPPVQNKHDELEPPVTTVGGNVAKSVQQKLDADRASFIPKFVEANYGDSLILGGVAAAAAIAGLYKGKSYIKAKVAGRTILNPDKPIIEELPQSNTTAGEALRTINQNANYGLESQATKFNDVDLVHDIATQTRAGMESRVEHLVSTGNVSIPGYEYQLPASLEQIVDFHLKLPEADQQAFSHAQHIMSQVDDAKLWRDRNATKKEKLAAAEGRTPEQGDTKIQAPEEAPKLSGKLVEEESAQPYSAMPSEPDIREAERILAKPENAGMVRMMNEIRHADAMAKKHAGFWDEQTASNMLAKRPNYVRRVETHDHKIVDGQVVPLTRGEAALEGMKSRQAGNPHAVEGTDLSSALERDRVNAPNQMLDAVLANVQSLEQTVVKAHENDIVKRFYKGLLADEDAAKSIKTLKPGEKVPRGFETASFYEDGKKIRFAVEPATARALQFNPTSAASRHNVISSVRNAFQQATTGPMLAPFFAGTAFTMEASITSATRARGMRVGYIDAALQAATGGRVAMPGDMLGTMAAGVAAVYRAQRADSLLRSIKKTEGYLLEHGNRHVQELEGQLPGSISKIAKGLAVGQDATLENVLAESRRLYEQTSKGWALKHGALHSSQNEMMRNANKFYVKDVLHGFQRQFGQQEGAAWYDWYKSLITNIHDGARLATVDLNRGRVSDKELAYQVRRASGDLGARGMGNADSAYILSNDVSKGAQLGTKAMTSKAVGNTLDFGYASIPYINPHIQGTTRFLEQMARQPTTTIAGVFNSTTLPFLGTLGATTALLAAGKPEYLDYYLNKREEYKKTGYWYVPIPGLPPEEGLDFRIDPVHAVFGYPAVEATASLFGLRKTLSNSLNRLAPDAEAQGMLSALQEGLKESIGFGLPIQASMALASQGISSKTIFDPTYANKAEQTAKLSTGKNAGSALSLGNQMMLEAVLGATAQHGIAGLDAFVSTSKGESRLANAGKALASSYLSKLPGASALAKAVPHADTLFAGKTFNESSTALAQNSRQISNSARRIVQGIQNTQNALNKSATAKFSAQGDEAPAIRMGNPGVTQLPPEVQQRAQEFIENLSGNGRIKGINSERSAITTSLSGLRGINAGNIGRHLVVPLKEGRTIGGLGYTILNEELLKKEMANEADSIIHPKMNKDGKKSSTQRPTPLKILFSDVPKVSKGGKVSDQDDHFYKPPTLRQVQSLKNALNERRYILDLQASDEYEGIQSAMGVDFNQLAKLIKLSDDQEGELSSDSGDSSGGLKAD